jgi:hypothetical protein
LLRIHCIRGTPYKYRNTLDIAFNLSSFLHMGEGRAIVASAVVV